MKNKKLKGIVLAIVLLFLCLLIVGWLFVHSLIYSEYKGYTEDSRIILIEKGMPVDSIINVLCKEGILKNRSGIKILLKLKGGENNFKAGEYLFDIPMSAADVYEKFMRGDIYYHKLTVIEGEDIFDISEKITGMELATDEEISAAIRNTKLISEFSPDAETLEGYLFPDTYLVSRSMNAEEILGMMVSNFKEKYEQHIRSSAEKAKYTPRELVIIASLIEKETSLDSERAIVSSVIYNRLKIGMGLQIDPTIIYALKMDGAYDGNLKRAHKQLDSPYNTYKYRGLPPGPIGNPGLHSLSAACTPDDTKYIYYVSKNDGSHQFSATSAEHNKAVYIWQKKYWQDKWLKEKQEKTQGGQNE
ncbi:MAG: endolytic transglycosylase MltG [Acidobacteria bacterium]|nr:endolytic transglycosylase MltG [Acidobacteriota bacterium]